MPAASPTPYNDSIGYNEPIPYIGMVAPVTTTSTAIDTGDLAAELATGVVTGTPGALDTLVAHLLPDTTAAADDSTTTVTVTSNDTSHTVATGVLTSVISGDPPPAITASVAADNTTGGPSSANTSQAVNDSESTVSDISTGTLSAAPNTGATTVDVE